MANTTTLVFTNLPDHRDDSNSGSLLDDSEHRLRRLLAEIGVFVSIAYS